MTSEFAVPPVRSPSGGIVVATTERGLPTQLKLHPRELAQRPEDLAARILALCQLSAKRMQAARRRDLAERGYASHIIRGLNLATEEELACAEAAVRGSDDDDYDEDGLPDSWMRSV